MYINKTCYVCRKNEGVKLSENDEMICKDCLDDKAGLIKTDIREYGEEYPVKIKKGGGK